MKNKTTIHVAILTVSDRCSRGESEDKSGPQLCEIASEQGWDVDEIEVIPDEKDQIQNTLLAWCDKGSIDLILTTGGTGLSPRDVTPQATREILDKEIPGLVELMRSEGRKFNPFSVLSQAVVGLRKKTLIINLPGNPLGAKQALGIILGMIPHALHVMAGGDHFDSQKTLAQGKPLALVVSEPEASRTMLTPHEALEKIFESVVPLGLENVDLVKAVDRTLGKDVTAQVDLPPFDNSAMDGFAVVAEDVAHASKESPVLLNVQEKIRAGLMPTTTVKKGQAVMIMTGAPLPPGATAVVMKEATHYDGNGDVRILYPASSGDNIRPRGEDVQKNNLLIKAGARIRPYEIALLAAQGFSEISVIRKPIVGVLATGDELVDLDHKLTPGKIHNSNGPALLSALRHWDVEGKDFGIAKDDPVELETKVLQALAECDMLLISGGVSVGDFDYTKTTLEKAGVQKVFWKVAIKPGKPLFFGITENNKYVFGLPGNPISALVCLEEFVRPALEKLQGFAPKHPSYHLSGKARNDYPLPAGRQQYLFCQAISVGSSIGSGFELKILRPQGSAMMGMAVQANALALPVDGATQVKVGDEIPFRWLK